MTWYAFGDIVLDRLLGVHRSDVADVHVESKTVRIQDIRTGLALRPDQLLSVQDTPPPGVCSLDKLVLRNGCIVDVETDEEVTIGGRLRCWLLEMELSSSDVVRLHRWMRRYPEIEFEQALRMRIRADFTHLLAMSARRPDVEVLLYSEVWIREGQVLVD